VGRNSQTLQERCLWSKFIALRGKAEAEDATQETFIKAWDTLEKYDMDRKFSTWLFTIGSNISNSYPGADEVVMDWDNTKNGIIYIGNNGNDEDNDEKLRPSA